MSDYKVVQLDEEQWSVQIEDRLVYCSTERDAILIATALKCRDTKGAIGYAYYGKGSGNLNLVENPKLFKLPHVFPIFHANGTEVPLNNEV